MIIRQHNIYIQEQIWGDGCNNIFMEEYHNALH